MNTRSHSHFAGLVRLILFVIPAIGLTASAFAANNAELEKLFKEYAESRPSDDKVAGRITALKDDAVDFLCDVIRKKEKHPVEYQTVQGKERRTGTWCQEAGTLLMSIDTPKVVAEARKLAADKNADNRFWGGWVLRGCHTERKENLAFLRGRLEVEAKLSAEAPGDHLAARVLSETIDFVAGQHDPADLPIFKSLADSHKDPHVKLSLWYAMALQGEKEPLVEIVKVCEKRSGHLGVVYLGRATGQDFGWDMEKWRAWLDKTSAQDFKKMVERWKPAPLPPPPAGQPELKVPKGTPDEIKEALVWSACLGLPSVKNLQRAQVVNESSKKGSKDKQTTRFSAWLLEEKDGAWRVLAGPDLKQGSMGGTEDAWPLEEQTVTEYDKAEDDWRSVRRVEKTDFKKEAEAMLAKLDSPPTNDRWERHGRILPERVSVFLTGRDCLELGQTDLAGKLFNHATRMNRSVSERRSIGQLLADDFALSGLWKITLDFGEPKVTREALLTNLEKALKKFPTSDYADRMKEMAEKLQKMLEEDKAHAANVKPFDTLTPEQQAQELVYQLRDQNGHQFMQPGWCDVFETGDRKEESPAHRLVKMGHTAVPALIKALGDENYSRSVGYWRNFQFSHTVLTVGDCAMQVLQSIAGERFYEPKTTSSYMSRDEQAKETREAAEKWWAKAQKEAGGGKEKAPAKKHL